MAGIELILSTICNATFCNAVYDNPLSDAQLTKEQVEYNALANEINGKNLKIATYDNYPLSWVHRAENGTLYGKGIAFKIVDILKRKFNFTYDVVVPKKNFEMGGDRPEESLIGLANSSQVDMVAAFISKQTKFRQMVYFSIVLDEGVWMMMLRRPEESAAGSGLLAPFNNLVWYLTLASMLSYGPCITLLTSLRSKLVGDKERTLPLSPSFWFVYSAFIRQGTNLSPEANTTRVLFATWWIFIILLSAFYTANLTAFLTLSKFTLDIETPKDLHKKNYKWVSAAGSSVQFSVQNPYNELYFLNKMIVNGRAAFRDYHHARDYLPLVRQGSVLVKEQIAIDHVMYDDYQQKAREGVVENERCTYVVAPTPFMKRHRAFVYPYGSRLKKFFDPVLQYIFQAGIIDFMKQHDLPSTKICPLDLQSKERQLRNTDLMMTYFVMAVGLAAALAVFIGEIIVKRYTRVNIKTLRRKRPKRAKVTNKHHDDTRPPPYESLFAKPKYTSSGMSQTQIINGREYYVYQNGVHGTRLVPVRAPSALLYR